jgi:hypothetical protein
LYYNPIIIGFKSRKKAHPNPKKPRARKIQIAMDMDVSDERRR